MEWKGFKTVGARAVRALRSFGKAKFGERALKLAVWLPLCALREALKPTRAETRAL